MAVELKTFDECIAEAGKDPHLMLGNGFSRGAFKDIFNYTQLANGIKNPEIKELFKKIDTTDFEYVMSKLLQAIDVLKAYEGTEMLVDKLEKDEESLKEILIEVIAESHPPTPNSITKKQYLSCYEFLQHFESGRKYTFNYDLILYWVYMHFMNDKERPLKPNDGFRTDIENDTMVTWQVHNDFEQKIFYLHGAMHIFKHQATIEKYTWINTGVPIAKQVKKAIEHNKLPVFISEGSKIHKHKRIMENGYLIRVLASMKRIGGSLFIYGHSLRDEDDHVFDLVNRSKVTKVFISLFGDENSSNNQKIIQKVDKWKELYPNKEYTLYRAESAQVWDRYA